MTREQIIKMGAEPDSHFLGRLESDCKYFLGNGERDPYVLWAKSVDDHISMMHAIYDLCDPKPTWISKGKIYDYEAKMKGKIICDRKKYHEIIEAMADAVYKGSLTWKDYNSVKFELTPLDLSAYPNINSLTATWINKLFDEESTDRNGNPMLRSHSYHVMAEMQKLGVSLGEYSDAISGWGYSDAQQIVYGYCEGDTTLQMFATEDEYRKEKMETLDWWKGERR